MLPYREVGLISLLFVGLSSLNDGCLSQPPDVVAAVQESPKDNVADGTAGSKSVAMEWARLLRAAQPSAFKSTADQFVGFVRGKLRTSPPIWWSNILATGELSGEAIGVGCNRALEAAVRRWQITGACALNGCKSVTCAPTSMVIVSDNGKTTTVRRDVFASFEERGWSWTDEDISGIAVTVTSSDVFIVLCCPWQEDLGCGEELYCIDLATGECRWKAILDDGLPYGGFTGVFTGSFTQLRANRHSISVWNAHDMSLSFHVFSVDDGRVISQFCTLTEDERRSPMDNVVN